MSSQIIRIWQEALLKLHFYHILRNYSLPNFDTLLQISTGELVFCNCKSTRCVYTFEFNHKEGNTIKNFTITRKKSNIRGIFPR